MRQVRLIKVCLNETYGRVRVWHISYYEWFEKRGCTITIDFQLALEYAIRSVQRNQDDLKLNGTHQILIYDDDIILCKSIHTVKKNTEASVAPSKESGLDVKADKTKYRVTSRDKNAGWSRNIKTDNSSFERVEEFKYLGITIPNQNLIQEKIKSILKSGNAFYHLVQNLLSSSLLSKI